MLRSRVFFLLLVVLCWPVAARADEESLTPAQAAAKIGQKVTVHMKVRVTGTSSDKFDNLLSESCHSESRRASSFASLPRARKNCWD